MFIKKIAVNISFSIIVVTILSNCSRTQALKCYVCEDCDSSEQLHELEVCGMPPTQSSSDGTMAFGTSGTPTAQPPSSGAGGTAPSSVNSNESDYDSEEDYENSSDDQSQQQSKPPQGNTGTTMGIMPASVSGVSSSLSLNGSPGNGGVTTLGTGVSGTIANVGTGLMPQNGGQNSATGAGSGIGTVTNLGSLGTNTVTAPGISTSSLASSGTSPGIGVNAGVMGESSEFSEEEDGEDDYENERRKRSVHHVTVQRQHSPMTVCYTVRLSMNDTVITNRGCTTMLNNNREQTCNSLFDGWNVEGCQLCENDECNEPIAFLSLSTRFKCSILLLALAAYSVMFFV